MYMSSNISLLCYIYIYIKKTPPPLKQAFNGKQLFETVTNTVNSHNKL